MGCGVCAGVYVGSAKAVWDVTMCGMDAWYVVAVSGRWRSKEMLIVYVVQVWLLLAWFVDGVLCAFGNAVLQNVAGCTFLC